MRRLAIPLLLVVLIALFGLGLALDSLFERYSFEPADEFSQVESFATGFAQTLNSVDSPETVIKHWPQSSTFVATIENKNDLPLPSALAGNFESGEALVLESEQGISMHYYLPSHNKVLTINTGSGTGKQNRGVALLFTSLFYAGTLTLVLLWLTPLLGRLGLLRTTAKSFGAGQLDRRITTSRFSYIQDIENDFNRMADKIQLLINDNKLLTSAVSHDLRTPLARLRFGIDTLAETDNPEARSQYLERVSSDLNEMEKLVNSLLRYARLDNVLEGIDKRPVDLQGLLNECISQYHDETINIQMDNSGHNKDTWLINGCIEHLATLFNNLIQNAIVHANDQLLIQTTAGDHSIEIAFCDDGPGIPVELHDQVMKPFQRGSDSKRDGYGLGLAVANRIASHHNAVVKLERCDVLGGARISVEFSTADLTWI